MSYTPLNGTVTLNGTGTALIIANNANIGGVLTVSGTNIISTLQAAYNAANTASGNAGSALAQAAFNTANAAVIRTGDTITGQLSIGNNTVAQTLVMNGAANSGKPIIFESGGFKRWHIWSNNTAENGSNTGSDLQILAWDDLATTNWAPFTITRSNKNITMVSNVSVTGTTFLINNIDHVTGLAQALTTANAALPQTGGSISGPLTLNGGPNAGLTVANNAFFNGSINLIGSINSTGNTILLGRNVTDRGIPGRLIYSANNLANVGDVQVSTTILYDQTSSVANTILTTDSQPIRTTVNNLNVLQLPNNTVYVCKGFVTGRDTINNNVKVWELNAVIKRGANASTTQIVGTPIINTIAADTPTSAWTLNVTADTANGAFLIIPSGSSNVTNWMTKIETIELG